MAKQEKPLDLVAILASAGQQELDDVRQRIDAIQTELHDFFIARKSELDSLKMVEKLLDRKLHPREKTQRVAKPKAERGSGTVTQKAVFDLLTSEGSMPLPAIAARLGKSESGVAISLGQCNWFRRENGEVHIARK